MRNESKFKRIRYQYPKNDAKQINANVTVNTKANTLGITVHTGDVDQLLADLGFDQVENVDTAEIAEEVYA